MAGYSRLPEKYFSVDVECVSTGPEHDAKAVSLIAVVDQNERVVLRKKVKPVCKVFSYLTPMTGIKQGDLDDGESFENAVKGVKRVLGPDVVIVGQRIEFDIGWLQLKQGTDYHSSIDLSQLFKTYHQHYRSYSYFPLSHEANILLERGMIGDEHDPATDAIASIRLFKKYYNNPKLLEEAKKKTLADSSETILGET